MKKAKERTGRGVRWDGEEERGRGEGEEDTRKREGKGRVGRGEVEVRKGFYWRDRGNGQEERESDI